MPIKVNNPATQGGTNYGSPFVGPIDHTAQIAVDMTALTNAEIDADGYIKPGLPLAADGTLVGAAEAVFGIIIEAMKVADGNAAGDIAAAGTQEIAVATICQVNQDIIEDNLGRVLSANELAGFALAGSHIILL